MYACNIRYTLHTNSREREREMEGGDKGTVCVTGGTGYLASWLIKKLLEQGYNVRTTVRSYPDNSKDLSFLTNLPGASKNLQIFSADLAQPESFDPVIRGCTGVFHVAHPIDTKNKEPEGTVTRRAIDASLAILKSCLDSKTVKRVVYTSSAAAVVFNDKVNALDVIDEKHWSDVEVIRKLNSFLGPYFISKTLTELAALDFAEKNGMDLVSVIPTFINGPFICPKLPESVYTSMAMIFGNKDICDNLLNKVQLVHVDDVASAHIFLFEYPDAKGRYNCSAVDTTSNQLSEFLLAKYPEYPIPTPESLKESQRSQSANVSTKKLLDTGFEFKYGLNEMYDEAIQCCKEKGFL